MVSTPDQSPTMPFGKHRGKPLCDVPTSYLIWLAVECKLSSGLRAAVVEELSRRGTGAGVPPPAPLKRCPDCQGMPRCYWFEMRDGRKCIRTECSQCGRWMGAAPQKEPYLSLAAAETNTTPVMGFLIEAEEAGVSVEVNNGILVCSPWQKMTPNLKQLQRQCRHALVRMLTPDTAKVR